MRWGSAHCWVGSYTLQKVNTPGERHAAGAVCKPSRPSGIGADASAALRARFLGRLLPSPAGDRPLPEVLDDTELQVRLAAALAMAACQGSWAAPRVATVLVHALGEVDATQSTSVVQALVRLGSRAESAVFGAIAGPVRLRSDRVRCMRAVGVAARLGLDSAVPILVRLRRSSHANLRLAAVAALAQLESAEWALMRFLSDPLPLIRRKAAEALNARDQLTLPQATALLSDADASIRKQAAKRLRQLGAVAAPSLLNVALQRGGPSQTPCRLRWSAARLWIAIAFDRTQQRCGPGAWTGRRRRT